MFIGNLEVQSVSRGIVKRVIEVFGEDDFSKFVVILGCGLSFTLWKENRGVQDEASKCREKFSD